ncbi:Stigma-specific protein Stig1 [Sesbania bispinosa]|nr:Stigma-specific protein Stig1 [Sesbania bispinosa]
MVIIGLSKGEQTLLISTNDENEATSLRGTSRFLSHISGRGITSCQINPRLCYLKGSPDCCNNKCVNLLTDAFNCGRCGKKCNYKKICCMGKCVNPMTNEKHCGKCGNKCNNGTSCLYGMCSYA